MANLLELSPEIICSILKEIRSVQQLYSFLQTSPYIYRAFQSAKDSILWNVEQRSLATSVLTDALTAVKLQNMKCGFNEVWSKYEEIRAVTKEKLSNNDIANTGPQKWITSTDLITLCRVQSAVNYFIDDFCSRKIPTLHHASTGAAMPISELERARLQRAFYRYDICHTMTNYPGRFHEDWPYQTKRCQLEPVLAQYTPWEVEEITCVQQYLHEQIQDIFDVLGEELMQSAMATSSTSQAATTLTIPPRTVNEVEIIIMSRFEEGRDDYFFSEAGKSAQEELIIFLAGRTFPFLRALFDMETHNQKDFVFKHVGFDSDRLGEALASIYSREAGAGVQYNGAYGDQPTEFEGDKVTDRNLAWLWSKYMRPPSHHCSSCAFTLRDWGYVFWDQDRIKQSGLIEGLQLQQLPSECPPRRERMSEASIQRRLEEMDLPEGWDLVAIECDD